MIKLNRIAAGWYASEDGHFAVVKDNTGYVTIEERESDGIMAGLDDDGWAAVHDPGGRLREDEGAGDTLGWFDTKREALEALQRHARAVV